MGKDKLITLDDFNVNALAEIQGKKEIQLQLVKDNPFIEVTDNATWETAKKSRTALRTGRTDLEKEQKMVISKVKEKITEPITKTYNELIAITVPLEVEQQAEVKRYEDIKENERLERERIEDARKQTHRDNIELFFNLNKGAIENLTFENVKTFTLEPKINGELVPAESFEEFQDLFESKLEVLKVQLADKVALLQDRENIRIEQERLADLRAEQERIQNIKISIQNYFTHWVNLITSLTFENIASFKKTFEETKPIDCKDLQSEYAEKRAELVKSIESRVNFLQENEQLRIDREAVAKQKQENTIAARKNQLASLGFDKDGAYDLDGLKIIFSEDDLLAEENDWNESINELVEKIRISKIPVIVETETIVSTEPKIVSTEPKTANTEVTQQEVVLTEPTRQELQEMLEDFALQADFEDLLKVCKFITELNDNE